MADTAQAKKEAAQLNEMVDDLEASLQEAVSSAQEIYQFCRRSKYFKMIGERVKSYTIGHLEAWLEDDNQTGSVVSVRDDIENELSELEDLDINDDPSLSDDDLEMSESFASLLEDDDCDEEEE